MRLPRRLTLRQSASCRCRRGRRRCCFALGLGKYVVGDTTYCDYPTAAKAIAKVGDVNTSYEKVLALHPTLIVADSTANARAVARLTTLHQPVLAVTPTSLLAVETSLRQIGARTGNSEASRRSGRADGAIRRVWQRRLRRRTIGLRPAF